MRKHEWLLLPALVVPVVFPAPAFAVQYLTLEQAQQALFPAAVHFVPADVEISAALKERIEQAAGVRVRNAVLKIWRAESAGQALGWLVLDEVIGKHEFITYAVALSPDGSVQGIEIMDYRETHGGQVRNEKWRAQFAGKKAGDAFRLDDDIKNISGATLSCKNIANGVKRIVTTLQMVQR